MTKKNKKIDTIEEGVLDSIKSGLGSAAEWAGRQVAKTGVTGSNMRDWAVERDAYIKAQDKFIRRLQQALDSAIDSGTITSGTQTQATQAKQQTQAPKQAPTTAQTKIEPTLNESKNVIDIYLGSLSNSMNNILIEAKILNEATVADFIKRFIKANGAYDWASHESELDKIANDFQTEYANSTFFPTNAAKKVFDFLYSIGSQAQRDQYGNIKYQGADKSAQPNQDQPQSTSSENSQLSPQELEQKATVASQYIRQISQNLQNPRVNIDAIRTAFRLLYLQDAGLAKTVSSKLLSDTETHFEQEKAKQAQAKTQAAESKKLRKKSV